MSEIVIQVKNLGKSYVIGHEKKEQYTALRDVLANKINQISNKTKQFFKGGQLITGQELEEFWALKDINFEIKQGDRVGIIGRNGAGKSTLLKILSRITEPTTGRVKIHGRVASLLEVGTGFHPELTGRENIYLNGAILGMSRAEIKKKFDEIVDFSSIEKFLDTPVKKYSSGMYVRLAFAVAAHLEPEILIVDEVLSVGDAEFQKKCLGKMRDVSEQGRTVLFVSHQMQAISALTERCLLLKGGNVIFDGKTQNAIDKYLNFGLSNDLVYIDTSSNDQPKVTKVEIFSSENNNIHILHKPLRIRFEIDSPTEIPSTVFSFQIVNSNQVKVQHVLIKDSETPLCRGIGKHAFECIYPTSRLYPDKYYLIVHLSDHITRTKYQTLEGICPFEVQVRDEIREYYWKPSEAIFVDECEWKIIS